MVVMGRSERGPQRGDHRLEWKERDVEREKTALFSLYIALPPATLILRIYVSSYIREIGGMIGAERGKRSWELQIYKGAGVLGRKWMARSESMRRMKRTSGRSSWILIGVVRPP